MCLGIPMKVVALILPNRARVESGEVSMEVSLQLVDDVSIGDFVIVHAGFAIQVMDPEAAEETLTLLREIAQGVEGAMQQEAPEQ